MDSATFACYMCHCNFDGRSAGSGGHSAGAHHRHVLTDSPPMAMADPPVHGLARIILSWSRHKSKSNLD
jgi:hypothetical protein